MCFCRFIRAEVVKFHCAFVLFSLRNALARRARQLHCEQKWIEAHNGWNLFLCVKVERREVQHDVYIEQGARGKRCECSCSNTSAAQYPVVVVTSSWFALVILYLDFISPWLLGSTAQACITPWNSQAARLRLNWYHQDVSHEIACENRYCNQTDWIKKSSNKWPTIDEKTCESRTSDLNIHRCACEMRGIIHSATLPEWAHGEAENNDF